MHEVAADSGNNATSPTSVHATRVFITASWIAVLETQFYASYTSRIDTTFPYMRKDPRSFNKQKKLTGMWYTKAAVQKDEVPTRTPCSSAPVNIGADPCLR